MGGLWPRGRALPGLRLQERGAPAGPEQPLDFLLCQAPAMSYALPVRRIRCRIALAALLWLAAVASPWGDARAQVAYVAGLEDVPLMAGLTPAGGNDVAF